MNVIMLGNDDPFAPSARRIAATLAPRRPAAPKGRRGPAAPRIGFSSARNTDLCDRVLSGEELLGWDLMAAARDVGHAAASAGRTVASTTGDAVGNLARAGTQLSRGNVLKAGSIVGGGVASQAKSVTSALTSVLRSAIRTAMLPKVRKVIFDRMIQAGEAGLESQDLRTSVIQTVTPIGTATGTAVGLALPPGGPAQAAIGASIGTASAPILVAGSWLAVKEQVRKELAFRKAKAAGAAKAKETPMIRTSPIATAQQRIAAAQLAARNAALKAASAKAAATVHESAGSAGIATSGGVSVAARDAAFDAMSPKTTGLAGAKKTPFNPLLLAIPAVAFLLLKARK